MTVGDPFQLYFFYGPIYTIRTNQDKRIYTSSHQPCHNTLGSPGEAAASGARKPTASLKKCSSKSCRPSLPRTGSGWVARPHRQHLLRCESCQRRCISAPPRTRASAPPTAPHVPRGHWLRSQSEGAGLIAKPRPHATPNIPSTSAAAAIFCARTVPTAKRQGVFPPRFT